MEATSEAMAEDPEAAKSVMHHAHIYTTILTRTTNVLQVKPPEDEFNAIIEFIKPLYEAWLPPKPAAEGAADQPAELAPTTNVAS